MHFGARKFLFSLLLGLLGQENSLDVCENASPGRATVTPASGLLALHHCAQPAEGDGMILVGFLLSQAALPTNSSNSVLKFSTTAARYTGGRSGAIAIVALAQMAVDTTRRKLKPYMG